MKTLTNNTLLRVVLLLPLFIVLTSCSKDEWRAKRTLKKKDYKEISISLLKTEILAQNTEIADLMVQSGVTNQASEQEISDLLLSSIDQNQPRIVTSLVSRELPFSAKTQISALHQSIGKNQLGNVNSLLKHGFPKEFRMENEKHPVSFCIETEQYAMARLLLSHGISPNDAKDTQPIENAVSADSPSYLVTQLIEAGANTNFETSTGTPFIHDLVLNSDSSALTSALASSSDITVLDADNKTLLHKAIATGEISKIDQLVNKGADIGHLDSEQNTFLHQAQLASDSSSITDYFLKKGLPIEAVNANGKNALDLALEKTRLESSQLLIERGAKVSDGTFNRLYSANNAKAVELLIQVGQVDPNTVLPTGDTLLIDAIKLKKGEIVKALLEQEADPNLIGSDGEPPLSYATATQNIDLMKVLIEKGATVDYSFKSPAVERFDELIDTEGAIKWFIKRDPGITPVMMACDQGNLPMVKLLMENGASNSGSKKYRFWPGNFAARRSVNDIVQYMVGAEPGHRDRYAVIDLSEQRTRVYDENEKEVMSFRISSGKSGHRTKTGEFVVTNKKRHHVSTLYNAPMPYFQRLSYGDFGFHTGVVPGYPASHGCIRCPNSYAYKLFQYLKVGDIVTIQK